MADDSNLSVVLKGAGDLQLVREEVGVRESVYISIFFAAGKESHTKTCERR